jgi:hypothetical protein
MFLDKNLDQRPMRLQQASPTGAGSKVDYAGPRLDI